ncbi:copper resistance CopC/CopD family protein [Amycolatopsis pigmentata]|uniref:FixH family protein n=1 Tax=Amycolatopsis pigmentata TaxID=450801 RepID=A0ABW5G0P8_9PSEU
MTSAGAPRRLRFGLLLLLTGVLALFAGAGTASAHAELDSTDPARDAVLDAAPARVTLTFSEAIQVEGDGVRVFDPDGNQVESGQATLGGTSGNTVGVGLRGGLGQGTYTVSWRVISADSHPIAGAFTFSVGHATAAHAPTATPPPSSTAVSTLYAFARALAFAAFAVLIGSAAFVVVCLPSARGSRTMRSLLFAGWAGSVAGWLGCLVLQGPYGFGLGLGHVFDAELVGKVLDSRLGIALVARLLLLIGCWLYIGWLHSVPVTAGRGQRWALRATGVALAAGLAVTWSVGGHASTGLQPALALPADVLHLLAMGLWLGGLTALLVVLARRTAPEAELTGAARRFSPIAAGSVAVLVITGSFQAWRQLGSWNAWLSTGYGRLLLVKVAVVALLVGAAAWSRRWVRQHGETGPRALRRSVVAETVLGLVVVSITALLVESEPGRAATAAPPGSEHREIAYDTGGTGGTGLVKVDVEPATSGADTVRLSVEDDSGRPRDVPELRAALILPARAIGPLEIPLRHNGTGRYEAPGTQIPAAGTWQLAVTVRTSDIDETVVATTLEIH